MGARLSDNCLMVCIIILNGICGIFGALLFSLAVWMRLEGDVRDWIYDLEMYQYWNGLYIIMAAGIIIIIISFCGCCGVFSNNNVLICINMSLSSLSFVFLIFGTAILLAHCIEPTMKESQIKERFDYIIKRNDYKSQEFLFWLYLRSTVLVTVSLILELAGAIYLLVNGSQQSNLTPWLDRTFHKLIIDSNYDPKANRILQIVQEKVGCCGSRNYQDYDRANLPISDYCRDTVSGNIYSEGCTYKFTKFIERRTGWIAGIALFVGFLQLVLVGFTICYWRSLKEADDDDNLTRSRKYDSVPTHVN